MNLHGTVGELMMKQAQREDMIRAAQTWKMGSWKIWFFQLLNVYLKSFSSLKWQFSEKMDAETLAKQLEMEAMADMFTKMTDSCHNKCISKFYDRKIIIVILLSNRKMLSKRYKNIR